MALHVQELILPTHTHGRARTTPSRRRGRWLGRAPSVHDRPATPQEAGSRGFTVECGVGVGGCRATIGGDEYGPERRAPGCPRRVRVAGAGLATERHTSPQSDVDGNRTTGAVCEPFAGRCWPRQGGIGSPLAGPATAASRRLPAGLVRFGRRRLSPRLARSLAHTHLKYAATLVLADDFDGCEDPDDGTQRPGASISTRKWGEPRCEERSSA